ncbi:MAG TPA: DUF2911 domain-containing protein [Cyclobacteriaceae bacterium]|jgi:hypothetical protein|nr:DUF2911 domain-containing protein [Cyclobacteriaceae bacterium]
MKKKIFIGLGIVLLLVIAYEGYQIATTKSHSPSETKEFSFNGVDMKVVYCRPYKKGRLIFGEGKDGALLPNGKYWRLGANEATEITFTKNITFGGQPVNAGSYRMYAVPNATTWKVALNSELGKWGAFEPDHGLDVLSVDVPVQDNLPETEQFTINFTSDSTTSHIDFIWDKTKVSVPITAQ